MKLFNNHNKSKTNRLSAALRGIQTVLSWFLLSFTPNRFYWVHMIQLLIVPLIEITTSVKRNKRKHHFWQYQLHYWTLQSFCSEAPDSLCFRHRSHLRCFLTKKFPLDSLRFVLYPLTWPKLRTELRGCVFLIRVLVSSVTCIVWGSFLSSNNLQQLKNVWGFHDFQLNMLEMHVCS